MEQGAEQRTVQRPEARPEGRAEGRQEARTEARPDVRNDNRSDKTPLPSISDLLKEGQEIIARHYYRPRDAEVAARYADHFPQLKLATIADFGGWASVQRTHFSDGGVFDQISAR